jgi:hypothetical protein
MFSFFDALLTYVVLMTVGLFSFGKIATCSKHTHKSLVEPDKYLRTNIMSYTS